MNWVSRLRYSTVTITFLGAAIVPNTFAQTVTVANNATVTSDGTVISTAPTPCKLYEADVSKQCQIKFNRTGTPAQIAKPLKVYFKLSSENYSVNVSSTSYILSIPQTNVDYAIKTSAPIAFLSSTPTSTTTVRSLIIPEGKRDSFLRLAVIYDLTNDNGEYINVTVVNPPGGGQCSGGYCPWGSPANVTIVNYGPNTIPSLVNQSVGGEFPFKPALIFVSRPLALNVPTTAIFELQGTAATYSTAAALGDYTVTANGTTLFSPSYSNFPPGPLNPRPKISVTIPAYQTYVEVRVNPINDNAYEGQESVVFVPVGAAPGTPSVTVFINSEDSPQTLAR